MRLSERFPLHPCCTKTLWVAASTGGQFVDRVNLLDRSGGAVRMIYTVGLLVASLPGENVQGFKQSRSCVCACKAFVGHACALTLCVDRLPNTHAVTSGTSTTRRIMTAITLRPRRCKATNSTSCECLETQTLICLQQLRRASSYALISACACHSGYSPATAAA